jgi:hypothetical protein
LRLLNVVIHQHQKKGKILQIPLWLGSVHFKLEVFIWRHVFYVPKSSITFRGILICVIFRPIDMQEYISMFSIALEWRQLYYSYEPYLWFVNRSDFHYMHVYLFCVLHHWAFFTRDCHGTAALQAQTTSIYDVIGHR